MSRRAYAVAVTRHLTSKGLHLEAHPFAGGLAWSLAGWNLTRAEAAAHAATQGLDLDRLLWELDLTLGVA